MNVIQSQLVKLGDLLAQPMRCDLTHVHVDAESSTVRSVALIADIEEITSVGPDTIVVLGSGAARGGWMISAALRYAWERRACAVIMPSTSHNPSVVDLAARFRVSLFSTTSPATVVALEVATHIGYARAELLSALHRLSREVDQAEDIMRVLSLASVWLRGTAVWIESSGVEVRCVGEHMNAATAARHAPVVMPSRVSLAINPSNAAAALIVTEAPPGGQEHARNILEICVTKLRALLAEESFEAFRRSLPPISLASLTGEATRLPQEPKVARDDQWATWQPDSAYLTVCIISERGDRYGAAIHQLWLTEFRDYPLVQGDEGWLAFIPLRDGITAEQAIERARAVLFQVHLLELHVGFSQVHTDATRVRDSIREAWLAARIAEAGTTNSIVSYAAAPISLAPNLLSQPLAEEMLRMSFPALAADPQRTELIDMFCTYASHLGSATAAAASLGVHRNTVKQRLARLKELGLQIDDPSQTLGLHLLLNALQRKV